jgi:hypothetical protein
MGDGGTVTRPTLHRLMRLYNPSLAVSSILGVRCMQPQTFRATLAILFLSMGLLPLGGCRVPPPPVIPIAGSFVGHIKADRYEEAYAMTSPAFRACFTKKQFEEFCRRRNLTRELPDILEPDRRQFPQAQGAVGVVDHRLLPFSITIVKGEDGQWCIDEVMLHEMDEKRLHEIDEESNVIK